jgi:hypothetical protein
VRGTRWLPTFELAGGEATLLGAGGAAEVCRRFWIGKKTGALRVGPATPTTSRGSCGHDVCDERRLVLSQLRYIEFGNKFWVKIICSHGCMHVRKV